MVAIPGKEGESFRRAFAYYSLKRKKRQSVTPKWRFPYLYSTTQQKDSFANLLSRLGSPPRGRGSGEVGKRKLFDMETIVP